MIIDGYQWLLMVITVYLNSAMVILVIGGYQWLSVVINGIENNFIHFKTMVIMVIGGYLWLFMVITVYLNSGYLWLLVALRIISYISRQWLSWLLMVIYGYYCVSQQCNGYLGYWWLPVVISDIENKLSYTMVIMVINGKQDQVISKESTTDEKSPIVLERQFSNLPILNLGGATNFTINFNLGKDFLCLLICPFFNILIHFVSN